MNSARPKASLGFLVVVGLLMAPPAAGAQGTRTYGTPSVSHTIQAFAFVPRTGAAIDNFGATGGTRTCSPMGCSTVAAVVLPAGALVTSIQLEACDADPSGGVRAEFHRTGPLASSETILAEADTGDGATLGCTRIDAILATPETIDNANNTYWMRANLTGGVDTTRLQAVRIFYHLQVSPAPAVATFNDVPTSHPFFLFIEALAAAGITAGCSASPPLYCPEDPLTRGQAAAFFGRALGLQFAP